jgi:hypothetical protein
MDFLVCARADLPLTVEGASFDRSCSRCEQPVMVAPSGQEVLRNSPETGIVCFGCFLGIVQPGEKIRVVEGAPEERCVPNTWGLRY